MTAPTNWWSTFFSGVALDVQKRIWSAEQTRQEADFIQRMLELEPSARVADVPCGHGHLTLELAARGYELCGVDLAVPLVEEARRKAHELGLKVVLENRDMRDLPWREELDAAFCFGNSYPYFDDAGNAQFLAAVHRALRPGGRFVLETGLAAESVLAYPLERNWFPFEDILFLRSPEYDLRAGRLNVDYTFVRAGSVETRGVSYPIYSYREHLELFEQAGFAIAGSYGSLAGEPYKLGSRSLYLVARKE